MGWFDKFGANHTELCFWNTKSAFNLEYTRYSLKQMDNYIEGFTKLQKKKDRANAIK